MKIREGRKLMRVGKVGVVRGFTLIELLVTIAVLVIVATIAVPNFQMLLSSNRLTAAHNEILSGLNLARSEAVKRREVVTLELDAIDGGGWVLQVKRLAASGAASIDCDAASETKWCVKVVDESSSPVTLGADDTFTYNALGRPSAAVAIEVSYAGKSKKVCVNLAGVAEGGECGA
ncbi:GspH/FimT family pseudopilin [Halomonas aestuarii]|uniref:GspH/FimT family pseudopilin n=1 Tax=Halomonas aestuarii TaxID=1897729 RepID=UPI0009FB8F20|nr:GspH/FimT family pseudopilin [Halomonas aestuarii]